MSNFENRCSTAKVAIIAKLSGTGGGIRTLEHIVTGS